MKISDKALGYISFAAILLIIVGVSFGMWKVHRETSTRILIDFDELGSLSPEDPVTENGYEIGRVATVEWLGNRSRVTIVLDEPVILHEGTTFRNAAFALMGQRRIEMNRAREGKVLAADHVFSGEFVPGITESLRFVADARDQLLNLKDFAMSVLVRTDSTPGLAETFEESFKTLENFLENLDKTALAADQKVRNVLDQASAMTNTVNRTADIADTTIRQTIADANSALSAADAALQSLATGIDRFDSTIKLVENDSTVKSLLESRELIDELQALQAKLQATLGAFNPKEIALFDENGNRIQLVRWKNLNIIGATAREKARERQKKSAQTP